MGNWTFGASAQGWSTGGFLFNGGEGYPTPGCLAGAGNIDTALDGLSIAAEPGDPWSMRVRFVGHGGFDPPQSVAVEFEVFAEGAWQLLYSDSVFEFLSSTADSGWLALTGTLPAGPIEQLHVIFIGLAEATGYLDAIYIAESPPAPNSLTHSSGGIPGAVLI